MVMRRRRGDAAEKPGTGLRLPKGQYSSKTGALHIEEAYPRSSFLIQAGLAESKEYRVHNTWSRTRAV